MRVFSFCGMILMLFSLACFGQTQTNTQSEDQNKELKNDLMELYTIDTFSLAAITPQSQNIQFIYWAPKERPILNTTVFPVASLTKMITADLIQIEIDEGKIHRDDTLEKWFGLNSPWKYLTVMQLVNQNSRIPNYTNNNLFWQARFKDLTKIWNSNELLSFVSQNPFHSLPWSYSNTNYVLLGMILEKVEGKPLKDIFDLYFQKNHMKYSFYGGDSLVSQQPISYFNKELIRSMNVSWLNAAGGIFAPPREMLLQGQNILHRLLRSKAPWVSTKTGQITKDESETAYSHGIFRMNSPYGQLYYVPGLLPGFTSGWIASPCTHLAFSFSANRSPLRYFLEYLIGKELRAFQGHNVSSKDNLEKDPFCHPIKPSSDFQFANMD